MSKGLSKWIQTRLFSTFELNQDPRYKVVVRSDDLQQMMNCLKSCSTVAFDYETSGIEWWKEARPCGIAFSARPSPSSELLNWYVPYRHHTEQKQMNPDKAIMAQKEILTNPAITKIAHNIKFDEHMCHTEGLWVAGDRIDTMIEAYLYNENDVLKLKERGFKDLRDPSAKKYDKMIDVELARLIKRRRVQKTEYLNSFGYSELDIYLCGMYAAMDTNLTYRLHEFYEQKGVRSMFSASPRGKDQLGVYQTEMMLTEVLCDMERIGCTLDIPYLKNLHDVLIQEREKAEEAFFKTAGVDRFNIGASEELLDYLKNTLHLELTQLTKSGKEAVDQKVLKSFIPQHPHLSHLLRWKDVEKKRSTYTLSLIDMCDEKGIVHGNFQQVGTKTGRMACSQPNLQNVVSDESKEGVDPESVKRGYVVQRNPSDTFCQGSKLFRLFADYSQIELRVIAHYTQDPRLLKTYAEDGDIHSEVENAVFGTVGPNRRYAKIIGFGISYGMSPMGFVRQIDGVSLDEAESFFNEFNAKFPNIPSFREKFWAKAARDRCQFVNMFGRRRTMPDLISASFKDKMSAQRKSFGSLIQGTAAELTKLSLVRMFHAFKEAGMKSRPVQTVHDEIQVDGPMEEFSETARLTRHIMEDFPDFSIPIKVELQASTRSWAEKTKF